MRNRIAGVVAFVLLAVIVGYLVGMSDYTANNGDYICERLNRVGASQLRQTCTSHAIYKGLLAGIAVAAVGISVVLFATRRPR